MGSRDWRRADHDGRSHRGERLREAGVRGSNPARDCTYREIPLEPDSESSSALRALALARVVKSILAPDFVDWFENISSTDFRSLSFAASKFLTLRTAVSTVGSHAVGSERIYHATRIVDGVTLCLRDYAQCDSEMDRFDAAELAGRLELAVEAIRSLNGGSH